MAPADRIGARRRARRRRLICADADVMTMRTVGYPDLGPLCGYVPRVSVLVVAQAMAKPFTMAAGRRTLRRDQVPRPRTARPDLPRLQYANRVRDGHRPGPSDPWPVTSSWPAPRARR